MPAREWSEDAAARRSIKPFMGAFTRHGHTAPMSEVRDDAPPLLAADASWALFLDFDGTLVELAETPDAVRVDRGLPARLQSLAGALQGALALVSGRPLATLDAMLEPLQVPAAGLHGVERRGADGEVFRFEPDQRVLDEARRVLARFVVAHPQALLEDKHASLALHYRRDPSLQPLARKAAEDALAHTREGFHIQSGHMVYEIKSTAADKGAALHAFLDEEPFAGRTPVFIGDDDTDEHGFTVVAAQGGFGVRVGNGDGATAARYRLRDPAAVHAWLRGSLDSLGGGRA